MNPGSNQLYEAPFPAGLEKDQEDNLEAAIDKDELRTIQAWHKECEDLWSRQQYAKFSEWYLSQTDKVFSGKTKKQILASDRLKEMEQVASSNVRAPLPQYTDKQLKEALRKQGEKGAQLVLLPQKNASNW